MKKKPIVLCIMDGMGESPSDYGNAVHAANTPNLDTIRKDSPMTLIGASGMNVGLPDGQMGNSEVGHTNMGAGRIVYQELTRISKAIEDGSFQKNEALVAAIQNAIDKNSALHLMGLMSDGGVHSHNIHLWAIIQMAKDMGLEEVYVHCWLDGRDVPPTSGADFVAETIEEMNKIGVGKIATVMGRYYVMDRDNRWERVEKAYDAMVLREGVQATDPVAAIKTSYEQIDAEGKNITDEFVLPTVIEGGKAIAENDSIICFNFRPDRAREITRAFVDKDFDGFSRQYFPVCYVCLTQYDATMPNVTVAFMPQSLNQTLGQILSEHHMKQLRIAETEKYAHVTFFFNGGVETVYEGEDRILVPSPKVATYDLQPEMSAPIVTEKLIEALTTGDGYDVVILNFANCDMVGHTGIFDAAVKAVEAVDKGIGEIKKTVVDELGGILFITADHGNAEKMYEADGSPFTAHTTNLVPFIMVGHDGTLRDNGKLSDIAPTILELLQIPQPEEMTGQSLLQ